MGIYHDCIMPSISWLALIYLYNFVGENVETHLSPYDLNTLTDNTNMFVLNSVVEYIT